MTFFIVILWIASLVGAVIIGKNKAQELLKIWLDIEQNGGTVKKVRKIEELEK